MSGPKNETPKETPAEEPQDQAEQPGPGASTSQAAGQATAAVSKTVGVVRERLVAGEQFVLSAALSIVLIAYLLFEFLLDYRVVGDFSVLLAVLVILAIWVHRWGHYDFGDGYRILIGALGVSLALLAIMNLLAWARLGGGSIDFVHFLGRLIYWAGAVAAGYGGWLVFRTRED
jgi:hypothetical protein